MEEEHVSGEDSGPHYVPYTGQLYTVDWSNANNIQGATTSFFRNIVDGQYNKFGSFEMPRVTNNRSDKSICLLSTNANSRKFDRVAVDHCGAVPRQGERVLMYRKSFMDWPISLGVTSWIGTNETKEAPGSKNHG